MNLKLLLTFSALCLLASSAWLLDELAPSPLTPFQQLLIALAIVCLTAVLAHSRKDSAPIPVRVRAELQLWGAILFALPSILGWYSAAV